VFRAADAAPAPEPTDRIVPVPLMRAGVAVPGLPTLTESRAALSRAMVTLPWEGLSLAKGDPAIPTTLTA
jgi:nicotinate phosphoribosyltransferase